jgi:hypothetical protein
MKSDAKTQFLALSLKLENLNINTMKKTNTFIVLLFLGTVALAQATSNLVVFSEDGNKFYLILNGIRQNEKAQTNVKIMDLNQPYYTTKIIFEDNTIPDLDKKILSVVDASTSSPQEVTYKIKKDKNGLNILRFFSMVPIAQAAPVPSNVEVIRYNTVPLSPITTSVTVNETTTTTSTGANVSVGSNIGGVGINVTINDPLLNGTVTHTSSTTTTTTSASRSGSTNYSDPVPTGCSGAYAMSSSNFSSAKSSISGQSFEDTKLSTARQIISSNCLTADQIKQVMLLFSFEDSKLTFAKEAHEKCVDKNNYFKVNDAFSFSSSVEDLNKSIAP